MPVGHVRNHQQGGADDHDGGKDAGGGMVEKRCEKDGTACENGSCGGGHALEDAGRHFACGMEEAVEAVEKASRVEDGDQRGDPWRNPFFAEGQIAEDKRRDAKAEGCGVRDVVEHRAVGRGAIFAGHPSVEKIEELTDEDEHIADDVVFELVRAVGCEGACDGSQST